MIRIPSICILLVTALAAAFGRPLPEKIWSKMISCGDSASDIAA